MVQLCILVLARGLVRRLTRTGMQSPMQLSSEQVSKTAPPVSPLGSALAMFPAAMHVVRQCLDEHDQIDRLEIQAVDIGAPTSFTVDNVSVGTMHLINDFNFSKPMHTSCGELPGRIFPLHPRGRPE